MYLPLLLLAIISLDDKRAALHGASADSSICASSSCQRNGGVMKCDRSSASCPPCLYQTITSSINCYDIDTAGNCPADTTNCGLPPAMTVSPTPTSAPQAATPSPPAPTSSPPAQTNPSPPAQSTPTTVAPSPGPSDDNSSSIPSAPSPTTSKPGSDSETTLIPLANSQSSSGSGSSGSSLSVPNAKASVSPSSPQSLSPPSPDASKASEGKSKSTVLIVLPVAGSLVLFAVAFALYRSRMMSTKRGKPDRSSMAEKYDRADTPSTSSLKASQLTTVPSNDFRNDKEFVRFRVDRSDVKRGQELARGGHGVVYRGTYDGRDVAIKQMLRGAWRNDKAVASFLDEIRMCARLDHPKIVEFIGVSWSSMRDLSAVTEFMGGLDLYSLLHKYRESSSGQEWQKPWTSRHLRSKTLIAMDVAEAVVYLHSFSSPIIHRDLKAKNVLLDLTGNAKLSDFGISREMAIDQTMTSEVGTVAWIAPEVLRGERYSEKADIFSLGVLLVELDRCSHPYANVPKLQQEGDPNQVAGTNAWIAVQVSAGKLKPSVSSACPADVADLVDACLSFEADERPTAMEVFYKLRQIRQGQGSE